ncbi:photosystem I assembly protein Ycf3 [Symmachiella macrocystis]|uniref:Photosystem I assembly protein Ycf3 n=1 Tax=Symmachiella macrocystis TaxID=2527985 RepID=A0A5C6BPP4_9PLAN|nr:hypothetical protein [Symmachiella macrocystis]TWU12979.1 photosystem I assembly protein Ycf3 [Symmachiella macrocystis]
MRVMKQCRFLIMPLMVVIVFTAMKNATALEPLPLADQGKAGADTWETPSGLAQFMAMTIEDDGKRARALTEIGAAQFEAGEKQQALETLGHAVRAAQKSRNVRQKASALNSIVLILVKARKDERVREVVQAIRDHRERRTVQRNLVHYHIATGDFERAVETVRTMESDSTQAFLLIEIAAAQVKKGDQKQALETLKQATEVAETIQTPHRKASLLNSVSRILFHAGDKEQALAVLNQALELAQMIENSRSKAFALGEIAASQKQMRGTVEAIVTLKQALEVSQAIKNETTQNFTIRKIAIEFAMEPRTDEKIENSNRRMKKEFTPEEKQIVKLFVEAMN